MPKLTNETKAAPPMEFIGSAPLALDPAVLELANQLSAIHGRIRVARESRGVHFYMASPACLEDYGADELHKLHLAVNVDKSHFVWVLSALILDGEQDSPVFRFHGDGYSVTLSKSRIFC